MSQKSKNSRSRRPRTGTGAARLPNIASRFPSSVECHYAHKMHKVCRLSYLHASSCASVGICGAGAERADVWYLNLGASDNLPRSRSSHPASSIQLTASSKLTATKSSGRALNLHRLHTSPPFTTPPARQPMTMTLPASNMFEPTEHPHRRCTSLAVVQN